MTDDVDSVLAQVVPLGGEPTQQELDLGDAVRRLVAARGQGVMKTCPVCGGTGRIVGEAT